MKTATLPDIHVSPNLRQEIEGVLEEGETLSQLVEGAVRHKVDKRKCRAEFALRGIAAIRETQRTVNGVPASEVMGRLEARLLVARQTLAQRVR